MPRSDGPSSLRPGQTASGPSAAEAPNPSRRNALKSISIAFAEIGLLSLPVSAFPQTVSASADATAAAQPAAQATSPGLGDADFLTLSRALTGHQALQPVTASRMLAAMRDDDAAFPGRAAALLKLANGGAEPEAILAAAKPLGLSDTMMAIVTAWYTGTVGKGPRARLLAYAEALMYVPVNDGLTVPTYCNNGPLWWTAAVPDVGVAPPRSPAAPASPATGGKKPSPPPVPRQA